MFGGALLAAIDVSDLSRLVDLLGVAAGAAGAALLARSRKDLDIAGLAALAFCGGLGGGLLRDILLQAGTPVALTDPLYLPVVVVVAGAVAVSAAGPRRPLMRAIRVLDALAIGFFAVVASLRAHDVGVTVPAQLLIGVIGGSGGVVLRDVLTATTPAIFRRGELNAIAALVAAGVVLAALALGAPRGAATAAGVIAGFGLRLAAIRYDIRAPMPRGSA
jgi:uncharacterized membrane protein YeiH